MDKLKELLTAVIFAAGKGISRREISEKLPEITAEELERALDGLKEEYAGAKGIHILFYNDKVQFSSNPEYGERVADILMPIKEKELSRTLLEVLSIVAYKQPVTRLDIEEIRGVSSEYAVSLLQKIDMIKPVGTKDAVGRPTLFGTTEEFLKRFSLSALNDLPLFDEVIRRVKEIDENYNKVSESLYRNDFSGDDNPSQDGGQAALEIIAGAAASLLGADAEIAASETPDFLEGEEYEVIE